MYRLSRAISAIPPRSSQFARPLLVDASSMQASTLNPEQILRKPPPVTIPGHRRAHVGRFPQPIKLCVVDGKEVLVGLLEALRRHHRERVPVSVCKQDAATYSQFVQNFCLAPVLTVLHRFRDPLLPLLTCQTEEILCGDGLRVILHTKALCSTPHAPAGAAVPVSFFFLFPGMMDLSQWENEHLCPTSTQTVESAHSIVAEVADDLLKSKMKYTIVTDTQSSLVLSARKRTRDEPKGTMELDIAKFMTHDHTLPLCLLLAAYTYASISREYISRNVQTLTYARGALNNPALPLPSDAEVFSTWICHSDFDLYTMENVRSRAEQFFRWKDHLGHDSVSNTLVTGDILTAATEEFFKRHNPLRPRYPVDPLSASTVEFLNSTRRSTLDPLVATALSHSQVFSFEIARILHVGQSRVVAGHVISADNIPLPPSSEICVKLFDSSLLKKPTYNPVTEPQVWFMEFQTCEDIVKIQDAAYRRLEHAQGSVAPFYYGAHQFELPNGSRVYGMAMELIDGLPADETPLAELSEEAQISFIRNARQCVRVIQGADISQADWHEGQILCPRRGDLSSGQTYQCVFIDLPSTHQSDPCYDVFHHDDYGEVKEILTNVGLRADLIESHYEPRERWDGFGPPADDYTLDYFTA